MRILSVLLENIKKFNKKESIFNFGLHHQIHTISGVNGSGKTAIFKAVQVFQKLFFFQQLTPSNYTQHADLTQRLKNEVSQLISGHNAIIDIVFHLAGEGKHGIKLQFNDLNDELEWFDFYEMSEGALSFLQQYWNISDPKYLIAFIDAGKSFSDFGVDLNNISLLSRKEKEREFTLECIFDSERTLQAIYKRTVIDHIQYRLDPSRSYEYFRHANRAIRNISPNIEVKNISATKVDGQIVMLGKTSDASALFDVKDFSAGERSLYLTILFLFYFPNVGILIIDEPENHLHESLLRKFYDFLKDLIEVGGTANWLTAQDKDKDNFKISSKDHSLSQIFLTTHSKALIYQNMNQGECLILTGDGTNTLVDANVEVELRAAGISTIFSRTLFVEGATDKSLFNDMLGATGITITSADSCKEVIEFFKKISKIKEKVHGAAFCFIIDKDNRSNDDIKCIRDMDPMFFDDSFIVLEKHEMENYLIDDVLISDALNPALLALGKPTLQATKVKDIFKSEATSLKQQSKAKYIASALKFILKNDVVDELSNTRNLLNQKTSTLVKSVLTAALVESIASKADSLDVQFENDWEENWVDLVDGKAFVAKVLTKLSKECAGIDAATIRANIIQQLLRNPKKYKAGAIISNINEKLDAQRATPEQSY